MLKKRSEFFFFLKTNLKSRKIHAKFYANYLVFSSYDKLKLQLDLLSSTMIFDSFLLYILLKFFRNAMRPGVSPLRGENHIRIIEYTNFKRVFVRTKFIVHDFVEPPSPSLLYALRTLLHEKSIYSIQLNRIKTENGVNES